jgi:hypothetical protein
MARQGNYVTIPGVDPNWAKGISSALSDLSNTYNKRAADERAEAERLAAAEESKRRFDLQESRAQALADRQTAQYENEQAMTDWYKSFGDNYNIDDVAKAKAKNVFGLTDEQLASPKGREALDIIKDNALYSEDITNFYGNQFASQFGKALDSSLIAPKYAGVSSLASLQAAEDKKAETLADLYEKGLTAGTSAAKELYSPTDGKSSSSSKSSGGVKTFADIMLQDKAKAFEGNWWLLPWNSDRQDATQIAQSTLDTIRKTNPDITPAEADKVIDFVLDRATTPDSWNGIDDGRKFIDGLIAQGVADARSTRSGNGRNKLAQDYLESIIKGDKLQSILPSNIRATRRAEAQKLLDSLYARTVAAAEKAGTPVATKPKATIADTGNVEKDILNTTGIGPKGQVTVDTPAATPRYTPSGTPFMGNQGINTVARAGLDGIIVDPDVMVNSTTGKRKDWLVNTLPGTLEDLNRTSQANPELWEAEGNTWAQPDMPRPVPTPAVSPEAQAQQRRLDAIVAGNQEAAQLNKAAATLVQNMPADRLQVLLEKGNLKPELKDRILRLLQAQ